MEVKVEVGCVPKTKETDSQLPGDKPSILETELHLHLRFSPAIPLKTNPGDKPPTVYTRKVFTAALFTTSTV